MMPLDREAIKQALDGQYAVRLRAGQARPPTVHVIGADGMLGRAFVRALVDLQIGHRATTIHQLDITDPEAVMREVREPIVINCAAWTNVDGAEGDEAAALRVNGRGVENLRDACFESEGFLVNFGTDYVFSGSGTRPYRTDDPLEPLNAYGRTKAAGERAMGGMLDYLHIRTSWLYAPWGNNFVGTIARLLREKPSIKVVNDQRGRPTSAEHLARVTLSLLSKGARGIYHATDGGECTWYDFATHIKRLTGAPAAIEPCATADFPRPAKRPAYSVLDLTKTEQLLGPMPNWKSNLAEVTPRLE